MTSKTYVPAMDTDGWVNSPIKVTDYLVSHFFLSDYSQTSEFKGEVASFAWILHRYQNDITQVVIQTKETLTSYFSKYFSNVVVELVEKLEDNSINNYGLVLYLEFKDQAGETHTLSRIIKLTEMKVTDILSTINNG